jgi:hypothetical protein
MSSRQSNLDDYADGRSTQMVERYQQTQSARVIQSERSIAKSQMNSGSTTQMEVGEHNLIEVESITGDYSPFAMPIPVLQSHTSWMRTRVFGNLNNTYWMMSTRQKVVNRLKVPIYSD